MNSARVPRSLALLLLLSMLTAPATAIIIRHDRSSAAYQVREGDFPAVFFLELQGARKVCVATLIHPRWALTAAHCLEVTSIVETLNREHRYSIRVAGAERYLDQVVVHPQYRPGEPGEVDLALLRFTEPLPYPQPLPVNSGGDELDTLATLLGWGYFGLGSTGRQYDDGEFRRAENRISEAAARLEIRFDDPRAGDQALPLEGMPGLGDSGGPLLISVSGKAVLAGVAVGEVMTPGFAEESQGRYGAVAVYERLSLHHDWITQVTGADAKPESARDQTDSPGRPP